MTEKELKAVQDTARLIAGNHSQVLTPMIEPLLIKMAESHRGAGVSARQEWLKALRALGETCLTLEKMERKP